LLRLAHERIQLGLHVRQLVPDMIQQHLVQGLGQMLGAVPMGYIPIRGMTLEEIGFGLERVSHGFFRVDVLLAPVDEADETEFERVDASGEDVERVGAGVHEIEFGEDADGASALWIDGACEFEGFGVGEVDVGGGDGENDATRDDDAHDTCENDTRTNWVLRYTPRLDSGSVVRYHSADPQQESSRTVKPTTPNDVETHLCQTRQIDQRQIQHVRTVYPKRYRQLADTLVLTSDSEGLLLDLLSDFFEISEAVVNVEELSPFCGTRGGWVRDGCVHELEDERSSGDDALTAGKKVSTDDSRDDETRWYEKESKDLRL
jgi:hypothetical protein